MTITNVTEDMPTSTNTLPMITVTTTKRRKNMITTNMLINIMKRKKMKTCLRGRSRQLTLILMQPPLVDLGMWKVPWMLPSR